SLFSAVRTRQCWFNLCENIIGKNLFFVVAKLLSVIAYFDVCLPDRKERRQNSVFFNNGAQCGLRANDPKELIAGAAFLTSNHGIKVRLAPHSGNGGNSLELQLSADRRACRERDNRP